MSPVTEACNAAKVRQLRHRAEEMSLGSEAPGEGQDSEWSAAEALRLD